MRFVEKGTLLVLCRFNSKGTACVRSFVKTNQLIQSLNVNTHIHASRARTHTYTHTHTVRNYSDLRNKRRGYEQLQNRDNPLLVAWKNSSLTCLTL